MQPSEKKTENLATPGKPMSQEAFENLLKEAVAVIDIGSSAIRMLIAEIDAKGGIRHLENLQKLFPA